MEINKEKACLCALNRIFGFEPKTGLALISHFGSARAIFDSSAEELERLTGPYSRLKGKISVHAPEKEAEELSALERNGITFCGITENGYPPLLKECEDPPIGIYIRSRTPACKLWRPYGTAVVGTRDISPYGREWCRKIVRALSTTDRKPSVISGLAIGVDIEAHKAAVESGLPTIAVMATGPESIYPYRHQGFAERLVETPGCALVTDFPPGTAPVAAHFLRRNRIIAGLGRSTILIESKIRGGGLMTCNLAFSYNRDIYALPGRADDTRSMGCNELIRKKIAEPITSIGGLIESLGMKYHAHKKKTSDSDLLQHAFGTSSKNVDFSLMEKVLSTIRRQRSMTIEDISEATGISYRRTSEAARLLEAHGLVTIDLLQRCCINSKNV